MASHGGVGAHAPRPWWRRYWVPVASGAGTVLLGGLALVLHGVAGAGPAAPRPAPSELAHRAPVSDADRERAHDAQARLRLSVVYPTRILENRPAGRTGPEIEDVQQGLSAAGFADATVRVATAADPAPAGSVIYAVRVGDACLIGYETGLVPDWSSSSVLGLRSDGRCLDA